MKIKGFHSLVELAKTPKSTLYAAHQEALNRQVVLKTSTGEVLKEGLLQAKIEHPGMVQVYDFIHEKDRSILVMEWVPGLELEVLVNLSEEEILPLYNQIAEALFVLHGKGFVHGDLHPGNILVRTDGKVKVLDLEFAVPLGEQSRGGRAGYQSPESVESKPLRVQSDLFSLASCLYFSLKGNSPFAGTWGESSEKIAKGEIDFEGISPALKFFLERAFALGLEFEDAEEFAEELELIMRGNLNGKDEELEGKLANHWKQFWKAKLKASYESALLAKDFEEAAHLLKIRQMEGEELFAEWKILGGLLNEKPKKRRFALVLLCLLTLCSGWWFSQKPTSSLKERLERDAKSYEKKAAHKENQQSSKHRVNKIWVDIPPELLENSISIDGQEKIPSEGGFFLHQGEYLVTLSGKESGVVGYYRLEVSTTRCVWTKEK